MRAVTHTSVSAGPDYALQVPSQLQVLLAPGMLGGLAGLTLLIADAAAPAVVD